MGHLLGKQGSRGVPCAELARYVTQQAGLAVKRLCVLHDGRNKISIETAIVHLKMLKHDVTCC